MGRCAKTLVVSILAVLVVALCFVVAPFMSLTYAVFPSLCPAHDELPAGLNPQHCLNVGMPGGLAHEMTAQMTQEQFVDFVAALKLSQIERFGETACKVQGATADTTAYYETYSAAFVRVEWDGGTTRYYATDLVAHPCRQS